MGRKTRRATPAGTAPIAAARARVGVARPASEDGRSSARARGATPPVVTAGETVMVPDRASGPSSPLRRGRAGEVAYEQCHRQRVPSALEVRVALEATRPSGIDHQEVSSNDASELSRPEQRLGIGRPAALAAQGRQVPSVESLPAPTIETKAASTDLVSDLPL